LLIFLFKFFIVPLGVYDPAALEQQNFFQNMNPGQRGSIFAPPPPEPPTSDCKYYSKVCHREGFFFTTFWCRLF